MPLSCERHACSYTANKKQCRGVDGAIPTRAETWFRLQRKVSPLKRVFLPPIMERGGRSEGGMGDGRARDTKRPHFRLLSDLRWDRWSQATSSTGKAWSQQKLSLRSPERPRGVQFLPDSLKHASKAKLLMVSYYYHSLNVCCAKSTWTTETFTSNSDPEPPCESSRGAVDPGYLHVSEPKLKNFSRSVLF